MCVCSSKESINFETFRLLVISTLEQIVLLVATTVIDWNSLMICEMKVCLLERQTETSKDILLRLDDQFFEHENTSFRSTKYLITFIFNLHALILRP